MDTVLRRSSRAIVQAASYAEPALSEGSSASPPPEAPAKKAARTGKKQAAAVPAFLGDDEYGLAALHSADTASDSPLSAPDSDSGSDAAPSPKKRKSPAKPKKAAKGKASAADTATILATKRATKPRVLKPEPTYVIPDVEKKSTTFHGRLGYACLNTVLRGRKPAEFSQFCSRTCRIDTIKEKGVEWAKELGRQNVKDLLHLIEWNEQNNIRFMRMSSEMFPFASHPEYGYTLEYAAEELAAVGALATKYGHRLTTHPGQFTQLGSPRKEVVRNAVRDLTYHCEMIDRMGLGCDSIMIIHGGGMFNDKPATLARIKENYTQLLSQNIKDRLVLENDEMCYSAEDLLPLCEELQCPLVFDYHHHSIFPSSISIPEIIRRTNAIFAAKGIKPKQHLSEERPGAVTIMERRAHSDRCQNLPPDLPDDMDLMIEAKDKEQAVLHLHRMYDLHPVIYESLRPPAEVETTQTKGRKSHKPAAGGTSKKKAAATGVVADDDAVKGEDPAVVEDADGEHAELGPAAKAEEHAVSPAKKKRAPKKAAEADDTKPVVEKKKRAPRKAKAEPVDPVLAELPVAPETTDVPMLDADAEPEPEPAGTKKRAPRKAKAKVEPVDPVRAELPGIKDVSMLDADEPAGTKKRAPRKGKAKAEPVAQDITDEPMAESVDEPSPAKKRKTTRKGAAQTVAIDAGDADAEEDALPAVRPRTKRTASGKPKAAH